jgi:CelD/BcsL family acetyltransferase involved in cellulose biosynthesis
LWEAAPAGTSLRYLIADSAGTLPGTAVDETGYILSPPKYGFDFDSYWSRFSGKSRKRIRREIEALGNLVYSHDGWGPGDLEWMFETNRANFGVNSYFEDFRFYKGFENMLLLLEERGMLRVSSVMVGGKRAAVDVGAVVGSRYTVLAGATDPEYPGIAKAINLFHIRWGFAMRFEQIDFLCGDFGWKERFHLEPRSLFISTKSAPDGSIEGSAERRVDRCPQLLIR